MSKALPPSGASPKSLSSVIDGLPAGVNQVSRSLSHIFHVTRLDCISPSRRGSFWTLTHIRFICSDNCRPIWPGRSFRHVFGRRGAGGHSVGMGVDLSAYYWCFRLTSPKHRLLASWINGWLTMVGVWTICVSVTFGTAQILIAGVGIFQPEWVVTPAQTYAIFVGVTLFATLVGVFFNRFLPTIDIICACWTALGVIGSSLKGHIPVNPLTQALDLQSCLFASLQKLHLVGIQPPLPLVTSTLPSRVGHQDGLSSLVYYHPVSTNNHTCAFASMAEEVHNPSVQLPLALSWIVPIGFVIGLIFLLPILFTLPDVETLLAVPGGQPLGVLFQLVMGSKGGGFGMWFILFGISVFCAISISCAASRATWSFARDKAIPLHQVWSKVNKPLGDVPLNAYMLSLTIQLLLGLIYLGSSAAFNAFVGVAVICLGASYAMPVAISVANGRQDVADAPFSLGRWGYALNIFAIVWMAFEIVLFSMPAVIPVTRVSMNYASVVFIGFAAISAIWYLVSGRYTYQGPPVPQEMEEKGQMVE
ncbi:unnamed protein product [Cyclocybe aegerita]|uniref:Uncharacterized protein n=1 Tax=Cyclocybe aegerita TaxID=1973307 RepID=A0A8S0VY84_CYCAE|nr:unnamed protein product [Cyclocybe aegerita]